MDGKNLFFHQWEDNFNLIMCVSYFQLFPLFSRFIIWWNLRFRNCKGVVFSQVWGGKRDYLISQGLVCKFKEVRELGFWKIFLRNEPSQGNGFRGILGKFQLFASSHLSIYEAHTNGLKCQHYDQIVTSKSLESHRTCFSRFFLTRSPCGR